MNVIFQYAGTTQLADTTTQSYQKVVVGPYTTPAVLAEQTTIGGDPLVGYNTIADGSDNSILGPGKVALNWHDNATNQLVASWPFANEDNLDTAISDINTALINGDAAVTIAPSS